MAQPLSMYKRVAEYWDRGEVGRGKYFFTGSRCQAVNEFFNAAILVSISLARGWSRHLARWEPSF